MKRLAILFVGLASLGADWPQKGDTVYVPGELAGSFMSAPLTLGHSTVTVPACTPMAAFTKPKPGHLYVQDSARGATFKLCEGWPAWIVQSRDACATAKPLVFQKKDGCYSPAH